MNSGIILSHLISPGLIFFLYLISSPLLFSSLFPSALPLSPCFHTTHCLVLPHLLFSPFLFSLLFFCVALHCPVYCLSLLRAALLFSYLVSILDRLIVLQRI